MRDRADLERYARILVDDCLGVQAGWQVVVAAQPLARPLVEEVMRLLGRRGAYGVLALYFDVYVARWLNAAPLDLIRAIPPIDANTLSALDAHVTILAPENTREGTDITAERLAVRAEAMRPHAAPMMAHEKPWVACQYPTDALAQEAGMPFAEFEEFLFGAVLIDWGALQRRMETIAARFEASREVRIVAAGTDIVFSIEGRPARVSAAGSNMPSGEFFFAPLEDSANGVIHYSEYPACSRGHQVSGVRLRFEDGVVVEAAADADEQFLLDALATDDGARRLGEFGVGCNPGIQRHTRNTLFDEKMEGTIHFAVGKSYTDIGGANESAIHWDMVKDLRRGGRIELDGEVVQENGVWLIDA